MSLVYVYSLQVSIQMKEEDYGKTGFFHQNFVSFAALACA